MRLLVVGDFHGKFPRKLLKIIKKEKIDVLVSNGDYLPFSYRKLWFKHCFGKEIELWQVIGKKRYKKLVVEDLRRGEEVLKKMNLLKIPVVTVLGNVDYPCSDDVMDVIKPKGRNYWIWDWERNFVFRDLVKKFPNIKLIDYHFTQIQDMIFLGARTHSFPGKVKSKNFRKHKGKLRRLFAKFRKENKEKRVIFVAHNVPYNTRLDKVGMKAHAAVRGKHYGSKLVRRIIDRYQPLLAIGGHIHEGRGTQKLGKTPVVNPGAIHEGHYAIVEIDDNNPKKIKIKFGR